MPGVYRILASRTELYLIEAYVKATDPQEAESLFYNAYQNEESAIPGHWISTAPKLSSTQLSRCQVITIRFHAAMIDRCAYSAVES